MASRDNRKKPDRVTMENLEKLSEFAKRGIKGHPSTPTGIRGLSTIYKKNTEIPISTLLT